MMDDICRGIMLETPGGHDGCDGEDEGHRKRHVAEGGAIEVRDRAALSIDCLELLYHLQGHEKNNDRCAQRVGERVRGREGHCNGARHGVAFRCRGGDEGRAQRALALPSSAEIPRRFVRFGDNGAARDDALLVKYNMSVGSESKCEQDSYEIW